MAGRYLVTGVQLGMLIGIEEQKDRQVLVNEIEDNQYVGYSRKDIKEDCKEVGDLFNRRVGDKT